MNLGARSPLPAFDKPYWLGITLQGEAEMVPGTPLGSAPYALAAEFVASPLGESANNPATSCAALKAARPAAPSGVYWLLPSSTTVAFEAYCDMVNAGGGWTLVWSNLRGGRGKPVTELQWNAAIYTLPRSLGRICADLESFVVYTGPAHWMPLAPSGRLRLDWAPDYRSNIDQRWTASFALDAGANWTIRLSNPLQLLGNTTPGLYVSHNNQPFSTYDRDNDTYSTANCASIYSGTPFWYTACWNGSFSGGGRGAPDT